MLDLLVRNARVPGRPGLVDLGISGGRFAAVAGEAAATIDAQGGLVTPPLVEPHVHLDAVLT